MRRFLSYYMAIMNKLIYPTLELFTYDPIEVLGDDETTASTRQEDLKNKLSSDFGDFDRVLEQAWAEVNEPPQLIFPEQKVSHSHPLKDKINGYQVKGFYYPVLLNDTYSFLFNCSVEKPEEIEISFFPTLVKKASTKLGQLGKTWIVAGAVTPAQTDYEAIAKDAYIALVTAVASEISAKTVSKTPTIPEWPQPKQEKFLDATAFQISSIPLAETNILENQDILILLYPSKTIMESFANFREYLRDLFCYRHKIRWAYKQAQELTKSLKASFPTYQKAKNNPAIASLLKNSASSSSIPTLEQLQTSLQFNLEAFYRYTTNLSYLQAQLNTIETNQLNYRDCLAKISEKASEEKLIIEEKFLKDFEEITVAQYEEQIKRDYTTLSSGLRIFDNLINTIRGVVEIEQAKRERSIEDAIAIVGFGVGAAGVAATVFTPFIENAEKAIQGGATINILKPSSSVKTSSTPTPSPTPNKDAPPDLSTWWLWVIFLLLCFWLGILSSWLGVSWMRSHRIGQSRD